MQGREDISEGTKWVDGSENAQCECFGSEQYVIDTTSAEFLLDFRKSRVEVKEKD